MCLNYTCIIFIFFNMRLHVFHVQFCCFRIGRSSARNYRAFETKSISYFMNIIYKHILLNFVVISFIDKEMVSLFQLHTYKFGLVYILQTNWTTFNQNQVNPVCMLCQEETVSHFLLHCPALDSIRNPIIDNILSVCGGEYSPTNRHFLFVTFAVTVAGTCKKTTYKLTVLIVYLSVVFMTVENAREIDSKGNELKMSNSPDSFV